jgi:hypothetical protein
VSAQKSAKGAALARKGEVRKQGSNEVKKKAE